MEEMFYLDAESYNDHNNKQRREANEFFLMWEEQLQWTDMPGEIIMDVGCGTGNSSTQLILKQFPNIKKIIATDGSEDMIVQAKSKHSHPKVEYFVADIQDESANRRWFGSASKVISIYCFHWLKNQTQAFQNVYNLLKPGGEAAILFVLNSENCEANDYVKTISKWKELTKGISSGTPESHYKNFGASHYKKVSSDIGFDVILCQEEPREFSFANEEIYKNFLSSVSPLVKHIPIHLQAEFKNDLLKSVIEHSGRLPNWNPSYRFTAMNLLLRKPFGITTS